MSGMKAPKKVSQIWKNESLRGTVKPLAGIVVVGTVGLVGAFFATDARLDFVPEAPVTLETDAAAPALPFLLVPAPQAPLADVASSETAVPPAFDREAVLDDSEGRITHDFKISPGLRQRVGFWFDIYTKYDDNKRVIHHVLYPWIVYKVVDVTDIVKAETPRRLWMRLEKADKIVNEEREKIRSALKALGSRRDPTPRNETEQLVADALAPLGGNLRKQAALAARELRVQTGQRNHFVEGLQTGSRYLGRMEEILLEKGLPTELARIPLVESSFNKHATSKIGASGIWQFTDSTGRLFMRVDEWVDERRSPFKATEGAARLLKENHMILFRSWPLAVTAWNHGPGGIKKAAKAVGSRDLADIVAKYRSRSFDFASSNFYAEFQAALHAERYEKEIFGDLEKQNIVLHAVRLPRKMKVAEILRLSGLSRDEFLTLNPDLKRALKANIALPAGFRLHLPDDAKLTLERAFSVRTASAGNG